jgi:hypothetical protein
MIITLVPEHGFVWSQNMVPDWRNQSLDGNMIPDWLMRHLTKTRSLFGWKSSIWCKSWFLIGGGTWHCMENFDPDWIRIKRCLVYGLQLVDTRALVPDWLRTRHWRVNVVLYWHSTPAIGQNTREDSRKGRSCRRPGPPHLIKTRMHDFQSKY